MIARQGTFKGFQFVIVEINGTQVMALPLGRKDFTRAITMDLSDLEKFFGEGDHVAVVSGSNKGVTGFVIRVNEDASVTIKRDGSNDMVREHVSNLTLSAGSQNEVTEFKGVKLHDLVYFGRAVGVVFAIVGDRYSVVDAFTHDQTLAYQDITRCVHLSLRNFNRGVDRSGNDLSVGDDVLVVSGPQRGSRGKVLHFVRDTVFVKLDSLHAHGGVFPIRCSDLLLSSAAASMGTANAMGMGMSISNPYGPRPGGGMGAPRPMRREPPRFKPGTRVVVIKGRSRGKSAVVRSCYGSDVIIETLVDGHRESVSADDLKDSSGQSSSSSSAFSSAMSASSAAMGGDPYGSAHGYDSYAEATPSWTRTPSYMAAPYTPSQQTPSSQMYSPHSSLPVSTPQVSTPYSPPSTSYAQVRTPRNI